MRRSLASEGTVRVDRPAEGAACRAGAPEPGVAAGREPPTAPFLAVTVQRGEGAGDFNFSNVSYLIQRIQNSI